jgi:hypothetical protein
MNKQILQWENIRGNFEDKNTSLLLGGSFSSVGGNEKVINEILAEQANLSIVKTIDDEHYQNIQPALIQAVRGIHISKEDIPINILNTIKEEILKYQNLFYTGYDLLIYWSLMSDEIFMEFRDYFKKPDKLNKPKEDLVFDENSGYSDNWLRVFYIHGGLHLYSCSQKKEIRKIKYDKAIGQNILSKGDELWEEPGIQPLCIIEGTSTYKLNFIKSSRYLSFAYDKVKQNTDANKLIVLANPLNLDKILLDKTPHFNQHLLEAIVNSSPQQVAISIVNDEDVNQQIKYWEGVIEPNKIQFFEQKSHPLCSPNITGGEQTDRD